VIPCPLYPFAQTSGAFTQAIPASIVAFSFGASTFCCSRGSIIVAVSTLSMDSISLNCESPFTNVKSASTEITFEIQCE